MLGAQKERNDLFIFNQFEEAGNHLWHYEVTGHAVEEVLKRFVSGNRRYAGFVVPDGIGRDNRSGRLFEEGLSGEQDRLAGEALQCPTLLQSGYGTHRIEGIGDKHVPWIHNAGTRIWWLQSMTRPVCG